MENIKEIIEHGDKISIEEADKIINDYLEKYKRDNKLSYPVYMNYHVFGKEIDEEYGVLHGKDKHKKGYIINKNEIKETVNFNWNEISNFISKFPETGSISIDLDNGILSHRKWLKKKSIFDIFNKNKPKFNPKIEDIEYLIIKNDNKYIIEEAGHRGKGVSINKDEAEELILNFIKLNRMENSEYIKGICTKTNIDKKYEKIYLDDFNNLKEITEKEIPQNDYNKRIYDYMMVNISIDTKKGIFYHSFSAGPLYGRGYEHTIKKKDNKYILSLEKLIWMS